MSMYSELLKIQKLRNEIITSLKTKLNTTEPLGLKDLSTKISGLSVGNRLIFASEKAGTYEIDLKQTGTYEIVAVGGGGGYFYSSRSDTSYQLGSGGYRKIRVFLEAGKYQAIAGKHGESGQFVDNNGYASTFSDFLIAKPGVVNRSTTKPSNEHAPDADSSNSRGECIEAIKYINNKLHTEGYKGYCLGNFIKYIWRCNFKNGWEDIDKAIFYLDRLLTEQVKDD